MTKPIVAVAALILVEECGLRLDDPVDELLPELADRRVLVDGRGPIDGETVAAQPADHGARRAHVPARARHGLRRRRGRSRCSRRWASSASATAPPAPQVPPEPDEWMRRLSTLPLLYQPGERWLYNTGSDVLGVLIARAAGQPLERVPARACVRAARHGRHRASPPSTSTGSASSTSRDPDTGERSSSTRRTASGRRRPAFPSGGGGLVSTLDDFHAFGRMLLAGGRLPDGSRLLSRGVGRRR